MSNASIGNPNNWNCIDCGFNTAPDLPTNEQLRAASAAGKSWDDIEMGIDDRSEVYAVKNSVWKAAGAAPLDGCLCIGCLEDRIGRMLKPKDFEKKDVLNRVPGTDRLLSRREGNFIMERDGDLIMFKDGVVSKLPEGSVVLEYA